MILLLSINKEKVISLWDDEATRRRGATEDERFVNLQLTQEQVDLINRWPWRNRRN